MLDPAAKPMPLDYQKIRQWEFADISHVYASRDAILYALAVGYGEDPTDSRQLPFVYEEAQAIAPTFPVVLGYPGFWMRDPAAGIDWTKLLHAGQCLRLLAPLGPQGRVLGRNRIKAVVDKGVERGALVIQEREIVDCATGAIVAVMEQATLCRNEGGFGGGDAAPPRPPPVPECTPDAVVDLPTIPQSALLYRLCADPNPMHVDPAVARSAGFDKPILHGLCSFGFAAHALLRALCNYDPMRLAEIAVRFSMPVFPGETLRTQVWRSGNEVAFRTIALERAVTVLDHGTARIR